jgi:hypothetical protein
MSWNGMFCDRTHSSMCQTSIDSNLGVLLRAGTDEKVPDKLVNTIRARKVPNNVTDVSFSNIEVNPRGFRILTRRMSHRYPRLARIPRLDKLRAVRSLFATIARSLAKPKKLGIQVTA